MSPSGWLTGEVPAVGRAKGGPGEGAGWRGKEEKRREGVGSPESWDLGGGREVEDSCSFVRRSHDEMGREVSMFYKWMEFSGISS